MILWKCW